MNMIYRLHNQPNLRGVSFSDQVAQAQAAVKNIDTEEEESEDYWAATLPRKKSHEGDRGGGGGGSGDEDCRHGCDCCCNNDEGKDVFAAIAVKEKYSEDCDECECNNFVCSDNGC